MSISPVEKASSAYAMMQAASGPSLSAAIAAKTLPPLLDSPAPAQKGDYVMSEWAKLIIIWSLLNSMRIDWGLKDAPLPGSEAFSPALPAEAGLTYGANGKMTFGPTPAGQALAGMAGLSDTAGMSSGMAGGAVTSGVGGGMAGAFVSVSV